VCGCCHVSVAFVDGKVVIAWRGIETSDIRDITVTVSADQGRTWTPPHVAVRDGWHINGCPHVGPTLATVGETLYLSWLTGAGGSSQLLWADSHDAAQTFSAPRKASGSVAQPTNPYLIEENGRPLLVFQARGRLFTSFLDHQLTPTAWNQDMRGVAYPVAAPGYLAWLSALGSESRIYVVARRGNQR
jgi:hypothetical protein